MRPLLEAHVGELPHPDDISEHDFAELHPDRPFPSAEFPRPDGWFWETEDEEPDDELLGRAIHDGFVPLRNFGCGEYDVIVVSGPEAGRIWTLTDAGVAIIPESEMGDRLDHQVGWVPVSRVPTWPERRECTARQGRRRDKTTKLVSEQKPPKSRVHFTSLDGEDVRAIAYLPGGIVRNVDLSPGAKRKTYDALVHVFPINQPRKVRTVARTGVPAGELGTLLTEDL
jgi:hypothetical protein